MRRRVVKPRVRLTRYMTIAEAAKAIGTTTRNLHKHLADAERRLGRAVRVTNGLEGTARRYTVTVALLRRHCPELFDSVSEAEELASERFGNLEEAIAELKMQKNALASKIRQMNAALDRLLAIASDSKLPKVAA